MRNKLSAYLIFGATVFTVISPAWAKYPEHWTGKIEGGDGDLTIQSNNNGLEGDMDIGGPGCGGELSGPALETNTDILILKSDDTGSCVIHLKKAGSKIVSSSEDGCYPFHGVSCAFSGANMTKAN
ncbi:hypothetical protein [Komagataeibacter swingsii]|uniref:hypothetical protein n=1 Tax=Komagataeibacter swingsii TaxID=215220 RepID=UPI0011B4B7E3|nr:hypothetical protein [Komagataeibacter swingsii]GBQ66243.1 hypothetical protein AA16373_3242 [Komagataeibacter swingsii DSM 16373]